MVGADLRGWNAATFLWTLFDPSCCVWNSAAAGDVAWLVAQEASQRWLLLLGLPLLSPIWRW